MILPGYITLAISHYYNQDLLKCSTCKDQYRSMVITKCGHSEFLFSALYPLMLTERF